ncbi:MAG: flagellar basal-body rod protein FlgF [Methylococcales bacterium]|nr:flagellar basal-body rod protein FlgF [Methylococcales bacterium]
MDRSLFIAMSGAKQTLLAQASNANNLANVNTTGFKADYEQFRAMPVLGEGFPTRVYAMTERPGSDMTMGPLQTTGNDLDIAIKGDGWIAVEDSNGQEAYTRAGDLKITPEGRLLIGSGRVVMGENGPIAIPPAEKIDIGRDGTISIIPLGSDKTNVAIVGQIKLVSPDLKNIEKRNDGLMHTKNGRTLAASADVSLVQGALEGSNVNAVSALVDMIELSKNFELQIKMMKTIDEVSSSSSKLMQMA